MADDANELMIAGEAKKRTGFKVCLGCGMVQRPRDHEPRHDLSCKYRTEPEKGEVRRLSLSLSPAGVRSVGILLPVSSYSNDRVVEASLGRRSSSALNITSRGMSIT
ncbi:hypothetical protein ACVXHB_30235 [Escherichia coli]